MRNLLRMMAKRCKIALAEGLRPGSKEIKRGKPVMASTFLP